MVETLKSDYDIAEACDGGEALIKLEEGTFDLLITDIKMPHVSGLEVIEHIMQNELSIPIIVCTGYPSLMDDAAKTSHIAAFFSKPIDTNELQQKVLNLIGL